MPNFFSSFFPTFGAPKDFQAGIKKAEQYALGYAIAISVAKALPQTAGPIGLALGLELAPGRGIKIKPAALPLLYAPQPIGVMPPHYYHLPDIMGEPLDLAQILVKPNARANLRARVEADYKIRDAEIVEKQKQSVRDLTAYQRQVFDDLYAGRVPRPPTPQQIFGLDKLSQPERLFAQLEAFPLPTLDAGGTGGALFLQPPFDGGTIPPSPARDGGAMGIASAAPDFFGRLVSGFVFVDQFFAANPPDP